MPDRAKGWARRSSGRQGGAGLLETTVSITVIAVLMWILSDRLLDYVRLADQAAMRQAVATLRLAMYLEAGQRAATGDLNQVRAMGGGNPMRWLMEPLPDYLGERDRPDPRTLPGGSWYFDAGRRELAYVPRRLAWRGELPEEGVFRFQVRVRPAVASAMGTGISGVELGPVIGYSWFGN